MGNDKRLEKLLDTYERAVATLRAAIALVNHGAPSVDLPSTNGLGGDRKSNAYRLATRLDAERAAIVRSNGSAPPTLPGVRAQAKPKKPWPTVPKIRQQRELSARFLKQFNSNTPKYPKKDIRRVAPLLRRGYLAKRDSGYIRTDKPFSTEPPTKNQKRAAG
jgi:hypothetical protein